IIILVSGFIINYYKAPKRSEEPKVDSGVMEFQPLTLCKETNGDWESVNSKDYPVNSENGVYNPTTNPEINYKCFCPNGKKWDKNKGCV
ncbi:MAG: hypothetical protein ABIJ23_03650, partial [Candidatus Magasanikbacteria bacterium]